MRMKWAQVLSRSFFLSFFLFFAFHRFSLPKKKKKKELAVISLMGFVFRCVQKLASKIASFFLRLLESWRTIAPKMKENATRKMAPGLGPKNSATGTEKIFRALKKACQQASECVATSVGRACPQVRCRLEGLFEMAGGQGRRCKCCCDAGAQWFRLKKKRARRNLVLTDNHIGNVWRRHEKGGRGEEVV